jgi:hypothetical protein
LRTPPTDRTLQVAGGREIELATIG